MIKNIFFVLPFFNDQIFYQGSLIHIYNLAKTFKEMNINVEIHTSRSDGFIYHPHHLIWNNNLSKGETLFKGIKIIRYPIINKNLLDKFIFIKEKIAKLKSIWNLKDYNLSTDFVEIANLKTESETWSYIKKIIKKMNNIDRYIFEAKLIKTGPLIDYKRIVEKAKKVKAKIIVGYFPFYTIYGVKKIATKINYPYSIIPFFHNLDSSHYNPFVFESFFRAEKILCLTNFEVNFYNKILNIQKNKLINVGAGLNQVIFDSFIRKKRKNKKFTILFISRLEQGKNVKDVIDLVANILNKDIELIIISNKRLENTIFPNFVKYVYLPSDYEKEKLITESNLIIFSSILESFGFVILDGWKYNKPVFVRETNLASASVVKKVIGNDYFIYKHVKDLIEKTNNLIKNYETVFNINIQKRIKDYIKKEFNWKKVAEKILTS